jgi:methionine biosynthesis protein MetW
MRVIIVLSFIWKAIAYTWREVKDTVCYVFAWQESNLEVMEYDRYWQARGRHSMQPRYSLFSELVGSGSSVLDIGCGDGFLLQYLKNEKNARVCGIDISEEAVRLARERNIETTVGDILEIDIECVYDYIILSEVLEHFDKPEAVIAKLKGKFRKALLISIPNIGYYKHRLRLLFGRFPIQWVWHPAEHLRFWTVADFRLWLRQFGLKESVVLASNGFPILRQILPNLFGDQVIFAVPPPPQEGNNG